MLKVMTLDLAHGRGRRWHQWLLNRRAIEANLQRVAALLRREHPDVVALQEADGPSSWSGDFDHIEHLAAEGGYSYLVRGEHVRRRRLVYGTALLSRHPVFEAVSVTFARSLPTPNEGFVVGRVAFPGRPNCWWTCRPCTWIFAGVYPVETDRADRDQSPRPRRAADHHGRLQCRLARPQQLGAAAGRGAGAGGV